ncbi:hypothetical protein HZU72_17745 [Halomonas sp. QX-2]|uniref:Uncharacterized protein n=1 Tax=Vreelandella sedimenti TaxID=2729618 RepID=A0A7Z0SN02_9GAMM|nr:hypothetical protein [Halomonas sedimenti]NYT74257.1 hypothetical protein [Halomonas sedimenti]
MKLLFLAKSKAPTSYNVNGPLINNIDTGLFVEGSQFIGSEETRDAGIYDMFWRDGDQHIVLGQPTKTTDTPWSAREGEWIDATDYDPSQRYIVATNHHALALIESGAAEYWQDPSDGKWTVRMIETEEEPTT